MSVKKKPLVVVTRKLPDSIETRMRELFDARLNLDDTPLSEAQIADAVRSAGIADRVLGGLTFGQWAAAFEQAACIVTIDTGATHVASAVKRPTIVLFEHTYFWLNSQEWSPYRVPNAVLRKPPTDAPEALAASRAEIVAAVARLL